MDDFLREYEAVLRDADARLRRGVVPKRRLPAARLAPAGALLAACLIVALVVAFGLLREGPSEERVAAPSPAPTFATPTAPTITVPPPTKPSGRFRIAKTKLIAPKKIAADAKLDETHGDIENLVRAWSAPAFKGHIYLERRGANWCLSAPDPLSPMPDIERGMGCNAGEYGASLTIGRNYAAVILDDSVKPPLLERADGSRTTLTPDAGGLIALANVPDGTSVTLYNAEGKGRRDPVAR
jgi:hypothetical protein